MRKMKDIINFIVACALLLLAMVIGTACSDGDDKAGLSKYPTPTISEFSPSEGYPSSVVTIKGTNFGSERTEREGRVYFGGVEATEYLNWSDNEIQVRVPENGQTGNISLWIWKNNVETTTEFTCIPGAEITGISPNPAVVNSTIVLSGKNFQSFMDKGVQASDVKVSFCVEGGSVEALADELTETTLSVVVPAEAKKGTLSVDFGGYQRVSTPILKLVGDYHFAFLDYEECGGSLRIAGGGIDQTKDGAWVIFKFTAPATGLFDFYSQAATMKDGSALNINISENLQTLKTQPLNDNLTKVVENKGSWSDETKAVYGPFYLKEEVEYYVKILFITTSGSWCANLYDLGMDLSVDQNQTPVNDQEGNYVDYVIYQHNFNSGISYYPFKAAWAWKPNYIEVKDQCLEFYYNYEALLQDNRRERRGAEVSCDFHTPKEGWYGFKIYLPEDKFPMNEDGIIIAQIFNQGCYNVWAGHFKINSGRLILSYRNGNGAVTETKIDLGKLETNTWYPVVLHFKVGQNKKGLVQAWIGDNMTETNPSHDSGSINFGMGHWIDDDTLDDTGTNQECLKKNPSYGGNDGIGCKFGLYVQNKMDITIRFDDIKVLEGNPSGAFDIVKPGN